MSAGSTRSAAPLGPPSLISLVWPTVDDIRNSSEGYAAGGSVPATHQNVRKPFLEALWGKWDAEREGRGRAMPHLKTFVRHKGGRLG